MSEGVNDSAELGPSRRIPAASGYGRPAVAGLAGELAAAAADSVLPPNGGTLVPGISEAALAQAIEAEVKAARTSFYWGMRLLPKRRRDAMFAIYAFCRAVDDVADEPGETALKRLQLDAWRREVAAIFADRPQTLIGAALWVATQRYGLRRADMEAVIDGMAMDAGEPIAAPSFLVLHHYCARVACAVGLLSVRAFGVPEPLDTRLAIAQGHALQLTNILRDVTADARSGRLYLPRELLIKHGLGDVLDEPPAELVRRPEMQAVCADLGKVAAEWYRAAESALADCPRRARRGPRIMLALYRAIFRRLERRHFRLDRPPVKVPPLVKLWIGLRYGLV